MKRGLAIVISALAMDGCTAPPKAGAPVTLAGVLGSKSTPSGGGVFLAQEAAAPAAPAPPAQKLLCDAPSLAWLVGHRHTDIPVAADLSRRRVSCTTCPASEDRRPERTDILFDARTGIIASVTCG